MVFKGYRFNIFLMYKVPIENALFNKTGIAEIRPDRFGQCWGFEDKVTENGPTGINAGL